MQTDPRDAQIAALREELATSRRLRKNANHEVAALREALMETLKAMLDLEAKALRHHRYREPLLTALTMRAGIDKILKAIRKHPNAALADAPAAKQEVGE